MHIYFREHPYLSLLGVSLLSGLLWRLELEYHGWGGLNWLSYFHFSIPLGFALFMIWANIWIQVKRDKRLLGNLLVVALGISVYVGLESSLTSLFSRRLAPSLLEVVEIAIPILLVLATPVLVYVLFRFFQLRIAPLYVLFSMLGLVLSIPIASLFLELLDHRGGADFIHTIKSGFLIPLWMFSLGMLVLKKQ